MINLLETKTLKLETISPVHIKGKDIEYGQGFVKRNNSTAYSIDSNKLAEYFFEKTNDLKLVESYIQLIEQAVKENNLKNFDNGKFLSDSGIYDHNNNRVYEKELITKGVFKSIVTTSSANQFIKDGNGKPYIPGSSIKGAIRTAVLFKMIKDHLDAGRANTAVSYIKDIKRKIDDFLKRTEGKNNRYKDIEKARFANELTEFIFQNGITGSNPNIDFFRAIKIKDSSPISSLEKTKAVLTSLRGSKEEPIEETAYNLSGQIGTIVKLGEEGIAVEYNGKTYDFVNKTYKKYLRLLQNNVGKAILINEFSSEKIKSFEIRQDIEAPSPSNLESKKPNKKYPLIIKEKAREEFVDFDIEIFKGSTEIEISIDNSIMNEFKKKKYNIPFNTIDELIIIVNGFNSTVWDFEKRFFDSCIDDKYDLSDLRSFYATEPGNNKIRVGWGTGITGMTVFMLMSEDDQKYLRNKIFTERTDDPAPKSRRLIYEDNKLTMPLGWIKINVLGDVQ